MVHRAPDAWIIGAQKAGSTSLDRYLGEHPEVVADRREFPALEDPDFARGGVDRVHEWIEARSPRPEQRVVLRRPNYLCSPVAPHRMRQTWPEVRLVATLRDPIDRAVSAYFHYMRYGLAPVLPVDLGMQLLLGDGVGARWPRAGEILGFGNYGSGLRRWFDQFPTERLLVVDSRSLRNEPTQALRDVADHIGVTPIDRVPGVPDGMPGSYGLNHVRLRHAFTPLLYTRGSGHRLEPRWKLPQVYDRAERRLWPDRTRPPRLDSATRDRLTEFYAPEARMLETLLEPERLPSWTVDYR